MFSFGPSFILGLLTIKLKPVNNAFHSEQYTVFCQVFLILHLIVKCFALIQCTCIFFSYINLSHTVGPQLEIGKKLFLNFSLKISGQKFKILAHLELQTKFKIPSTTEYIPVDARRFEEFLPKSNLDVIKIKKLIVKDKTIEKLL